MTRFGEQESFSHAEADYATAASAFHVGVVRVLGPSCLVLGPSSGPGSLVHGAAGATFAERQGIRAQKTLVDQGRRTAATRKRNCSRFSSARSLRSRARAASETQGRSSRSRLSHSRDLSSATPA